MSEDSVQVILLRLQHMEQMLEQIHAEVKRTNGRVTSLEMENAKYSGEQRARRMQTVVVTTVVSGSLLAAVVWFVQAAI
jgi:type VI protein secretion system component VasF